LFCFVFSFAPATLPFTFSASGWEWEQAKKQIFFKRKGFFKICDSVFEQHLPVKCC